MKKAVWYLKWIILFLVLIGADQMTKQLAVGTLKGNTGFPIIKNVFKLFYLENHGAAFGLFQNQRFPLLIVTIVVLLAIGFVFNEMDSCCPCCRSCRKYDRQNCKRLCC